MYNLRKSKKGNLKDINDLKMRTIECIKRFQNKDDVPKIEKEKSNNNNLNSK